MKKRKNLFLYAVLLSLAGTLVFSTCQAANGSPDYAYYKGKTLKLVVPYKPGGHFDRMARLVAHFMAPALGAKQIHVINRPGGAAIVGTNAIYNAKPNGLTFGITPGAGVIISQIANTPGVHYDVRKFDWIGEPGSDPEVLWTHKHGKLQSFKDLMKLNRPFKNLASGKGGVEYVAAELLYSIFGIPHKMISVFNSHKIMSTFLSGEGDGFVLSASSTLAHAAGKVTPLVVMLGHESDHVPGVPTVLEEADHYNLSAQKKQALKVLIKTLSVHRAFFAPPGVPQGRLAALRDALRKVSKSKDFHHEAKKEGLFLGYSSSKKLAEETHFALSHRKILERYLGSQN